MPGAQRKTLPPMPVANRILDTEPVPSLAAYLERGGGKGLAAARALGAAGHDRRGDRGRHPRPRRRRLPDRREVAHGRRQRVAGRALDGRRERGRGRARLVQGPRAPRPQPVPRARRRAHRRARGRRRPGDRRHEANRDAAHRARARRDRRDAGLGPRGRRAARPASKGPPEYLLGEETALLEAIDGRYPFPRIAPPYRRGVDEMVETAGRPHLGVGTVGARRDGRRRRRDRSAARRSSTTSRRSRT